MENIIERKLIEYLTKNKGYTFLEINNKSELEDNIIKQLSKLNNMQLNSDDLSELRHYIFDKSIGDEAYHFNSILFSNIPLRNRKEDKLVTIRLFHKCAHDNTFQIIHQYRDTSYNGKDELSRYDVTVLINGIPMVQIELKDMSVEIGAAVNQINRYIDRAYNNWFKLIQLYIVSNETNTRYCSNNNTKLDKAFMFRWTDADNNLLDNLYSFAETFLDRYMLFDIIEKYMVRRSGNGYRKSLLVMRPYQIFAIKAVECKINKPFNTIDKLKNNGFVFHTTGSGKTLTSFKCIQRAAELPTVDKVIFLVDRQDLDSQTVNEFKSIDSGLDIDGTDNTKQLLKAFKNKGNSPIITTIQKMSIAIKKAEAGEPGYDAVLGEYRQKHVVFVIDECHRTQFGSMHASINRYFEHSRYIGFTGTPIYKENSLNGELTTSSLFGEELHSYRIDSAIKDKNVLGFAVDYHNTIKLGKSFSELSSSEVTDNPKFDTDEILENPDRIKAIVDKIFEIHSKKTQNQRYTALFAVGSIQMLLKYYYEFKRHNKLLGDDKKLRISAIFTPGDAEVGEGFDSYRNELSNIMQDFNKEFELNCEEEASFRAELTKSLKCYRDKHLDIVIVVNIFLTGFDSKMTNTLYVDKNLVYHGLLQAFSRTNRVESERKSFGNIVCFRPLKENVDNAIRLFNKDTNNNVILTKTYEDCYKALLKIIDDVLVNCPKDFNMANSTESEKIEFVKKMRKLNHAVNEIKQFTEFSWDNISDKLTQENYNRLIGQLKDINNSRSQQTEKESLLDYIDFCMELIESDRIDLDYINKLISNIDTSTVESVEVYVKNIKEVLDKSTSDTLVYKKEIIKKFLDRLIVKAHQEGISSVKNVQSEFRKFVQNEKEKAIKKQSKECGLDKGVITEALEYNEITGKMPDVSKQITEATPKFGFKQRKSIKEKFYTWLDNTVKTFKGLF